ncbi:MAG: hypothetical protein ABWK01_00180 [Infirmifilum sp.]
MVMLKQSDALGVLFVDDGEESKLLLSKLGDYSKQFKIVNVTKNGLRGWLVMEYGTTDVPLLVTENIVVSGAKNIEEQLRKLLLKS